MSKFSRKRVTIQKGVEPSSDDDWGAELGDGQVARAETPMGVEQELRPQVEVPERRKMMRG